MFLIVGCLVMATWGIAKLDATKHPPVLRSAIGLAIFAGLFSAYFVPWFGMRVPSSVMVFRNRIFRSNGCGHGEYKFENIASFRLLIDDRFRVLAFQKKNGRRVFVGTPLDFDTEAVIAFLECRGVRREPVNQMTWNREAAFLDSLRRSDGL